MSKSMMVALVALFFSLSGWGVAAKVAMAPANTVNTQSIVNGSIRLADLSPSTVRLLKGQRGEEGPQGFTGAPGPAGPAGPAGGFNPARVSYVGAPQSSVGPYSTGPSTATCPSGSIPIGGGGFAGVAKMAISNAVTGGWQIVVYNDTSISTTISAMVVCAAP